MAVLITTTGEQDWRPHFGPSPNCNACKGTGWVCEDHDKADACDSALKPCLVCNHPFARCPVCGDRLNGKSGEAKAFIYRDVIEHMWRKVMEGDAKERK